MTARKGMPKILTAVPCPSCGKLFKPKFGGYAHGAPKRQLTCSKACWTKIRYMLGLCIPPAYRGANRHICDHCGKEFEGRRREERKYCSKPCWHAAHSVNISNRLVQMPPGQRWNRRDLNEPKLLEIVEKLGGFWTEGPPLDGWIYHRNLDGWIPVEIKQPGRKGHAGEFTKAQKVFFSWCSARNAPWLVWRCEADVLRDLNSKVTS